jgi:hypothetical protein
VSQLSADHAQVLRNAARGHNLFIDASRPGHFGRRCRAIRRLVGRGLLSDQWRITETGEMLLANPSRPIWTM